MKECERCGEEHDGLNEMCDNCCDEYEQEMHESMSEMFDTEGNNLHDAGW